ncbi:metallophosphoesterase [uncultured Arthrobacter sp.]|uniref:metallophosphoesterase n=1 Tax=uncultured Arthrobacter sp. TaxID=114050 RepID=UPI0025D3B91C|nr:metallophosphoesterase [uncultured Arthrobacter sp.]
MRDANGPTPGTRTLRDGTLVVFVSDTHIGGDEGQDYFESPEDLAALFAELAGHAGPVELVLAGDFFDFLKIGDVPPGENRASATISRPGYRELFSALRHFAGGDDRRVVYLPGNHDAEAWWNPEIRRTLREDGLVHEFALSYAARFESAPESLVYCEHGNQFDPANTITDYEDPLDTPFGDHIVTDVVRRISPVGRIGRDLHLRDIGMVYPLATIPQWVAGRVFYDLLGRVARYLLLPLLVGYASYRTVAYGIAVSPDGDQAVSFWDSSAALPGLQSLFGEIAWDALLLVTVLVLFFLAVRRAASRAISSVASTVPGERATAQEAGPAPERIEALLRSDARPPAGRDVRGREMDVFVSGHTHAPSLSRLSREPGDDAVIVNSGCWLRQLRPVRAHLGQPPVFVPEFVLTHARVFLGDDGVRVELWEHLKPVSRRLRSTERLAILGRLPAQPAAGTKPRVSMSGRLSEERGAC